MARMVPDQTFYPSPALAMSAPPETLAYVAMLNPGGGADAIAVLDVDGSSTAYGSQVSQFDMPNGGDELHHFGWNACSSCLCPFASHPHMERRYCGEHRQNHPETTKPGQDLHPAIGRVVHKRAGECDVAIVRGSGRREWRRRFAGWRVPRSDPTDLRCHHWRW